MTFLRRSLLFVAAIVLAPWVAVLLLWLLVPLLSR